MREVNRRAPSPGHVPPRRGRSADGLVVQSPADLVPDHPAIPLPGGRSLSPDAEQSQNLPQIIDHVLRAAPGVVRSVKAVRDLESDLTRREGGNLKVTLSHDPNQIVEVEVDLRAKTNVVANLLSLIGNAFGSYTETE